LAGPRGGKKKKRARRISLLCEKKGSKRKKEKKEKRDLDCPRSRGLRGPGCARRKGEKRKKKSHGTSSEEIEEEGKCSAPIFVTKKVRLPRPTRKSKERKKEESSVCLISNFSRVRRKKEKKEKKVQALKLKRDGKKKEEGKDLHRLFLDCHARIGKGKGGAVSCQEKEKRRWRKKGEKEMRAFSVLGRRNWKKKKKMSCRFFGVVLRKKRDSTCNKGGWKRKKIRLDRPCFTVGDERGKRRCSTKWGKRKEDELCRLIILERGKEASSANQSGREGEKGRRKRRRKSAGRVGSQRGLIRKREKKIFRMKKREEPRPALHFP